MHMYSCSTGGNVQLVGGNISTEGHAEVCVSGEWGTVCDDNQHWDAADVQVVCRQLDYYGSDSKLAVVSIHQDTVPNQELAQL